MPRSDATLDRVDDFVRRLQPQPDLWRGASHKECCRSVSHHQVWNRLPLAPCLSMPALGLSHSNSDARTLNDLARCKLGCIGDAAVAITTWLSHELVFDSREPTALIEAGDKKLCRPSRLAMYDVKILHHH